MNALTPVTKIGPALDDLLGVESDNRDQRRYLVYLLLIAFAGWALASYDFNLLAFLTPAIAKTYHLSPTAVGWMFVVVTAAMFLISFGVGWAMDERGRKWAWTWSLVFAACFTGLTYFVSNFPELITVRALASGTANAELAISITLVNEQVPAKNRGLLYAFVQGAWPVGFALAAVLVREANVAAGIPWHVIFLFGVPPLFVTVIGRRWVRRSERYVQLQQVRQAKSDGDDERVDELLQNYDVDVDEIDKTTLKQLFSTPGWVRSQVVRTSLVWLLYSSSFATTNIFIAYWLQHFRKLSAGTASTVLLVAGAGGLFFYIIGGTLGERFGRQRILVASAALSVGMATAFYFIRGNWQTYLVYFFLYQATNGLWSGVGYSYWAESFPTRVRGTAVGWLGSMYVGGLMVGSAVWTGLIGTSNGGLIAWWVLAMGFAAIGTAASTLLPNIPPGQKLEDIAT